MAGSGVRRSARVPGPVLRLSAVGILERGLSGEGSSALDVLTDPRTREVVWFTVWQAIASTLLTIVVALPASYVLGRYRFRGRSVVSAVVLVPFVLPTVVVALAFLAILPGPVQRGWAPILVAHVFFNVAVVVRIVGTFWANLDSRLSEAAATLGASPWRRFREITVPLLSPALAAAAAIVFLFSFTSFGIVLILGGPRYATLEAEIYDRAVRMFDLRAAAVLSLVQLACVLAAVLVAARLERRVASPGTLRPERDVLRRPRTRPRSSSSSRASAASRSSSASRWRSSSNARSPSAAATASPPTGRSVTRRASCSRLPGPRS